MELGQENSKSNDASDLDDGNIYDEENNRSGVEIHANDNETGNNSTGCGNPVYEKRKLYTRICEQMGFPIISTFIENICTPGLRLCHRGIGSRAMKGIALSLRHDKCVTSLDLTDNNLDKEAGQLIASIFRSGSSEQEKEPSLITRLNLSMNRIGAEGASCILDNLNHNYRLAYLNISDNRLPDKIARALGQFLSVNTRLEELDLSKNELSTQCSVSIRAGLEKNERLSSLDLSWNHFRGKGAGNIASSLSNNKSLTSLKLSWNGFADDGADQIGKSLSVNQTLACLDLSYNRISDKGIATIADALGVNKTLENLRLGWNPITSRGVKQVIEGCLKNPSHTKTTIIKTLHFESILIDADSITAVNSLMALNPGLKLTHGGYAKGQQFNEDIGEIRKRLLQILLRYLEENRLRMVDLFNMWDKDKSYSLTREEFRKGVEGSGIPFTKSQLNLLVQWLDDDNSDSIEYNEFVGITEIQ